LHGRVRVPEGAGAEVELRELPLSDRQSHWWCTESLTNTKHVRLVHGTFRTVRS
jgi:hypothetical protein